MKVRIHSTDGTHPRYYFPKGKKFEEVNDEYGFIDYYHTNLTIKELLELADDQEIILFRRDGKLRIEIYNTYRE